MACASEAGGTLLYSTLSPITSDWCFFRIICIVVPKILEPSFCLEEHYVWRRCKNIDETIAATGNNSKPFTAVFDHLVVGNFNDAFKNYLQ
jgi:hypothetical protein